MDFLVAPCEAVGVYKYALSIIDFGRKNGRGCIWLRRRMAIVAGLLQNATANDAGLPTMIIINRDFPFVSSYFKNWSRLGGIKHKRVSQARHDSMAWSIT